jgi:hypothetical protein
VGLDLEKTEFAFNNLKGRSYICRFQRDIRATENFVSWRYLDEKFGHASDRNIALAR